MRNLIRHRMNLVRDRTRLKNRVHALPGTGTSPEVQRNRPRRGGHGVAQDRKGGALPGRQAHPRGEPLRQIELLNQLVDEADLRIALEAANNPGTSGSS
ncbi:MAG: hypothetical protein Q6352_019430 [Candidatus Freyrarchaeum guaymaensis]